MHEFALAKFVFGTIVLMSSAMASLTIAIAHEGQKMECNEASMNAMTADIQSMPDGDAKTTAMKEMQMAEDMMAKHDMERCKTHMSNAMEATEK